LTWARDHGSKATLIYAWNEYDEGGWLSRTLVGNDDLLDAVRDALTSRSGPTVAVADASVTEGQGATVPVTFELSLSSPSEEPITVDYATADGTGVAPDDYVATSGTLTFAPGETTQSVSVDVVGDTQPEAHERFRLVLQDPPNARLDRAEAVGTIVNDDVRPPPDTWLSDMTAVSASNGNGPVERDMSVGGAGARDGRPITLNGVVAAKGLGVHAVSTVTFSVPRGFAAFVADVGVDDECVNGGSVVFQVLVNGVKRFDSGVMRGSSTTKTAVVDVAGSNQLALTVTNAGDGGTCDHADWANARLVTTVPSGSTTPTTTTTTTTPTTTTTTTPTTTTTTAPPTTTTAVPAQRWVSDLTAVSSTNGWGPVERDMSVGGAAAGDGRPIMLNGVVSAKGLGVHAQSIVEYSVGSGTKSFTANVGVDDECGTSGSIVFQVLVDGVKRFDSGLMTGASATKSATVTVAGAKRIALKVTNGGDGAACDHGDWAGARFS
jgi:hypothetical protein